MKHFQKLFFLGIFIPIIAFASLEAPFPDVASTNKNAFAISYLKNMKIIAGDGKTGLFKPDRILNRAEFAKMIGESRGWTFDDVATDKNPFPDLDLNQWYAKYILKAHKMGVIKGTGEGKAEASRSVFLIEALAMTFRAYEVGIPQPTAKEFWYDPILKMGREQYILDEATEEQKKTGHLDSKILTPYNEGVPRAEAAQIIYNSIVRFGSGFTPDVTYDLSLSSPAFSQGGAIPGKYTCDGSGVSPPLTISSRAPGVKSYALIMDDPDAPGGTWVHWVMWNIPADVTEILEGTVPPGATQGKTSFQERRYGGPCPPSGTHRYFFKLYALDNTLSLPPTTSKSGLEQAMLLEAKILGEASLMGTYQR